MTYVASGATLSSCGRYRYRLWREWRLHPAPAQWEMWKDERGKPVLDGAGHQIGKPRSVVFIMLNPSTADGSVDDPTIRRCVGFAKAWGYDRLEVVNLFAYRATNPRDLLQLSHVDPVGDENQRHIEEALCGYPLGKIVCAWGSHGSHLEQGETVLGWLGYRPRYALGLTSSGQPRHPLYVPGNTPLIEFKPSH